MFLIEGPIDRYTYALRSISKMRIYVPADSYARTDVLGRIAAHTKKTRYKPLAEQGEKGSDGVLIRNHRIISAKDYLSIPCLPNGDISPNINISKYPTLKEVMDAGRNQSN